MRYILFLLLSIAVVFASTINYSLLKIHSNIVPKLLLMDYEIEKKALNNTIYIAILYENSDYAYAKQLKDYIEQKYKNGLKSYALSIKLISYDDLDLQIDKANLFYLFPTSQKNISSIVQNSKKLNNLTFSYSNDDLQYGVMCSLKIGSKVKPILNLKAIEENKTTFRPVLLNISEVYTPNGEL